MSQVYIAIESFSAVVILILLYANLLAVKQNTQKQNLFIKLLIANEIVVVVDTITWFHIDWSEKILLFRILITITYVLPMYVVGVFAKYVYVHISDKTEVSKIPFIIEEISTIIVGCVLLFLCISGKMFVIENGIYLPGTLNHFYYLFYVISLLYFSGVIIANFKKLGTHDFIAALSFCFFPLISIIISMFDRGINLAIPSMAINMLIVYIVLQSEWENKLYFQSNNDELTGLYNRRAYETDILHYNEIPVGENFVYAAVDVNGLKQTNDNLGHSAGDELICAAASCLNRSFGDYGRVYRTGGDEFVAMFYANEDKLKTLEEELDIAVSKWHGNLVDSLFMSIGYATKKEFPEEDITEISKVADKRMYEAKRRYYASKGVDRRGQAAAHKALCNLYTKILKINLTTDSYSIINMDVSEQTPDKGFSSTISEWLSGFGKTGQIHNDDLELYLQKTDLNYLKAYFSEGKTSISILYRRRYGDIFKQVAMEMIPADDYEAENQSLFLYVKNIDM